MRLALLPLTYTSVVAFPNYIPCASDDETLLVEGTHTCGRALGGKGSEITMADDKTTLTATSLDGTETDLLSPGETVDLHFSTDKLNRLLGQGVWMTVRVSDSGSSGVLRGPEEAFEAVCPSQMATMKPIPENTAELQYRAPCDAADPIKITVAYSKCNAGCSTATIAATATMGDAIKKEFTPQEIYLVETVLQIRPGAVDPSCSAPAPPPMPPVHDICQATECFDGDCEGQDAQEVKLKHRPTDITVSRWDSEKKQYTEIGNADAHVLEDKRWGSLMHGPTRLGGNHSAKAIPGEMPPVYVSVDASNSVYRLDDISFESKTATSKIAAWAVAPASQHHIMDQESGALNGMVISSGQPFGDTKANGDHEITQGGVYSISKSGCHKLYPSPVDEPEFQAAGAIVNRVVCHDPSGVCFFSNWNHEFDETSVRSHCLHWCALDDPSDPTSCAAGAPLAGGPENSVISGKFCAEPHVAKDGSTVMVAPHGLLIGEAHQDGGVWHLELISSFTDGLQDMTTGVSFARKIFIDVQRSGEKGENTAVEATKYDYFGTQLTTDTVAGTGNDVGLDHMWRDAAGYVWFSTFRHGNAGEHVLDYETGQLLLSFHGFDKYNKFNNFLFYYNPSGITIVGGLGEEGSVAVVAIETVPPVPMVHAALYFVDISPNFLGDRSMLV